MSTTTSSRETTNRGGATENEGPRALGVQAKFFPLERIRLGVWESHLQLKGQLFAMVLPKKFIYVVVHPAREISSPTLD